MKTANIAFRNLTRQKKRSILLASAIAFGIMVVTLINGFAGAFVSNVSDNVSYLMAGHIFITGMEKMENDNSISVIRDDTLLAKAITESGIDPKYINRRSEFSGSIIFEGKKLYQSISGMNLSDEVFLRDRLVLRAGSWDNMSDPHALILSDKISEKLNVEVGDRLLISLKTVTGQNNVGEFILAGICYDTGILGSLSTYANLDYVNELIGLAPGEYSNMGIMLDSISQTGKASEALYAKMKESLQMFDRKVETGEQAETPFMAMMRTQNKEKWEGIKYRLFTIDDVLSQIRQIADAISTASTVILTVLFIIVMIGITNTFRMIMYERIREIGTMRAIGVQRGEIRSMFLFEALFLSLVGTLAGLILALIAMGIISAFDLGMNSPLFIILRNGHLSFRVPFSVAAGNILLIAMLTLLAAYFPARKAAKLDPAVALRTLK